MIDALKSRIKSAFMQGDLKVEDGERLPVFQLETQDGEEVRSENIRDAVLYFYPKAGTSGCTKEACKFSDELEKFDELDVEVYGVSTDSRERLRDFREEEGLDFELLSDEDKKVSKKMGVLTKAGFAERTTFLLKDGVIEKIVRDVSPDEHVEESLKFFSKA